MRNQIKIGDQAFLSDGGEEFGAVREIRAKGELVVYVENAGDFVIPADAIAAVHARKVVFQLDKLEPKLRVAIAQAHDAEDA